MSVINGQDVEASIVNNAFMSRNSDTGTVGKVSLSNNDSPHIEDAQSFINKVAETIGTTESDPNNLQYSSNEIIQNGDNHKVAIGKLDAGIHSHQSSELNPHNVTKSQIGLGDVTNDPQLKREAGDFDSFDPKASPSLSDIILIEDSLDGFIKKKVLLGDIGIGGGGGVRNFLQESDVSFNGENGVAGWVAYQDADSARPVDGTGGSPTVSMTTSLTNPLSGEYSLILNKPASNVRGQGVSANFSIDNANQARVLKVEFDYNIASGDFNAGTSSDDSDVIVYLYDVTNNRLIEPSTFKLFSNSTTIADRFSGYFQTSADSVEYRLILHVATSSASAFQLRIDNVIVTPSRYVFGTPITDWVSYTPTFTNLGTPSSVDVRWRRVGGDLELIGNFTNGTVGGGAATFSLPSGLTSSLGGVFVVGNYGHQGTATGSALVYNNANNTLFFGMGNWQIQATGTQMGTGAFTSFVASVPIQGWSSSVRMSDGFEARDVVFVGTSAGTTATANVTDLNFTTVKDSVSAWSGSSYTVRASGDYLVSLFMIGPSTSTLSVYVNGTNSRFIVYNPAASGGSGSVTLTNLRADDVISIRSNVTQTFTASTFQALSIHKLASPQTTAQGEKTIEVRGSSSGQVFSHGVGALIQFPTSLRSTHNLWNGSLHRFTANKAMDVFVNCSVQLNPTGTQSLAGEIRIRRNGTIVKVVTKRDVDTTVSFFGLYNDRSQFQISGVITLNAGDYIDVTLEMFVEGSGTVPLMDNSTMNYLEIFEIK